MAGAWEGGRRGVWVTALLCVALLALGRFAHVGVLWVDEAYGMAAARALLDGQVLYREVWFDKPPLYAWVYLLVGGLPGIWLRVLGTGFGMLCCWLSYGAARALFGEWEGRGAALLMAFFLVFATPAAVASLAPDALTIPFALGMAWLAARGMAFPAALVAGLALLANGKALYLLPVVVAWLWPQWRLALAGYAAGALAGPLALWAQGSLEAYWQQVWAWGAVYARETPFAAPYAEGVRRTANWMGFHAALLAPTVVYFVRRLDRQAWPLAVWFLLALASVAGGWRFYPRYYLALLPVTVVLAAHGLRLLPVRWRGLLLAVTLAVPLVRFGGPLARTGTEAMEGRTASHRDLALWADADDAASRLRAMAGDGDTLLVWGYRPEMQVLAGLPLGTPFLDSQPLTGVIADRHLERSDVSYPELAARNRRALTAMQPTWIADWLGALNPALAPT
nr:hypothetical protein [Bryobacterales bacterium]